MQVMSAGSSWQKIVLVLFAGLMLAACQTSGLKSGALKTDFPPAGWKTQRSGNDTAYFCTRPTCSTPQLVVISPTRQRGNVEEAIKRNIISTALVDELFDVLKVASRKQINASSTRKITTPTYSGFEHLVTLRDRNGKKLYLAVRNVIQRDRGIVVTSAATSPGIAKRNLARFFAQTTIQRVQ